MNWPPMPNGIRRTMDATAMSAIANHPDVRPWLGGDGPLDLSGEMSNPRNLAGVTDSGGFVAVWLEDARYEVHSLFLPRGKETIHAMRSALDYIFIHSDAQELITKVPDDNPAASGLARLAGFQSSFRSVQPWSATVSKPIDVRTLRIESWALRSSVCHDYGTWLHEQFETVKAEHASTLPAHSEDDAAHLAVAGAATLMIRAGNVAKGVLFYNRWAQLSGYAPIQWLRDHPIVIDMDGMIVEVNGAQCEVLQCR